MSNQRCVPPTMSKEQKKMYPHAHTYVARAIKLNRVLIRVRFRRKRKEVVSAIDLKQGRVESVYQKER